MHRKACEKDHPVGTIKRWLWSGAVAAGDWCHLCGGRDEPSAAVDILPNAEHWDEGGSRRHLRACRTCLAALLEIATRGK